MLGPVWGCRWWLNSAGKATASSFVSWRGAVVAAAAMGVAVGEGGRGVAAVMEAVGTCIELSSVRSVHGDVAVTELA
jgi:hypothetical protein